MGSPGTLPLAGVPPQLTFNTFRSDIAAAAPDPRCRRCRRCRRRAAHRFRVWPRLPRRSLAQRAAASLPLVCYWLIQLPVNGNASTAVVQPGPESAGEPRPRKRFRAFSGPGGRLCSVSGWGRGTPGAAICGWGNPASSQQHGIWAPASPDLPWHTFIMWITVPKQSVLCLKHHFLPENRGLRVISSSQLMGFFLLTPLRMSGHRSHAVRHRRSAHAALPLPPFRTARLPCAQPLFPPARAAPGAVPPAPPAPRGSGPAHSQILTRQRCPPLPHGAATPRTPNPPLRPARAAGAALARMRSV